LKFNRVWRYLKREVLVTPIPAFGDPDFPAAME